MFSSFSSVNDLTARLEKLEQNITLTLQEVDHNFSACQYKVTTKVLPQITRFACVSEDIWENSKLWWSFFESLDLTTNDTFSATSSEDYINLKKRLIINETSSLKSETSKATATNSMLNNLPKHVSESLNPNSTANDTISALDYIDLKKNFDINGTSSLKSGTSEAAATNSILNNPSKYNSLTSTPLQEPQYAHKMLQSPSWGSKKIEIKKSSNESTLTSDSIVLPSMDSDYDFAGISPPVTIQFSVAPSKLLKTPAKEAAKLIMDELVSCLSPDITTPSNSNKDGFTISSLLSDINRRYQVYSPGYKMDRVHVDYVGEKLTAKKNDTYYQVKSTSLAQSNPLGTFAAGGSMQQLFTSECIDDDESEDDTMNSPCPAGPVVKSESIVE
ncbi:hypothetical protein RhiirA5_362282 [Rhizophagus irregularis]|uniref:DASH complex subunit ASK1 n=3 Tax=Rhizophagus irregularis TaxID=588596 RepID=A0A2I1H2R5_9GLOM|nr:Ask1p [Rhizophagus irregularis DAOM 197198w]PKC04494.1 hypothetical protein RhiirA5_362282 [Rhizophagus irregularis]GBC24130.1 DASH complex subunit ask1 [Rhizophagus irregularis DAOM 181602=DAOM 197198]PKC60182.1 hypothetical protein RhiirA1_426214 [Rhizophagus irregularis]PKY53169.1 hypothetical protein RhiirA4_498403 [Rhizophagus irregularis]